MEIGSSEQHVEVQFYDQDIGYENLWATPLGDDLYRMESIPFFIYDVSLNDIVNAKPDDAGKLQFLRVVGPSGNRTLRARKSPSFSENEAMDLLSQLEALGCQVEILRQRVIAIDIPPRVDLKAIADFLTKVGVAWEYGNPSSANSS